MVGCLDDFWVVLDDEKRVAGVAEAEEGVEEAVDIAEVEAGGGFVEKVEGVGGLGAGEFEGEFEPLGFAAGEGVGGLAEGEVAEAQIGEGV